MGGWDCPLDRGWQHEVRSVGHTIRGVGDHPPLMEEKTMFRILSILFILSALVGCRTTPPIQVILKPQVKFTHKLDENTKLEIEL